MTDIDTIREAKVWYCKIGEVPDDLVPPGGDFPMRQAVAAAYKELTGRDDVFLFSGWGAELTESERAVVENRLPDHKGFSMETCVRCGWTMGSPPLNCQNDDTPHSFPSQARVEAELAETRNTIAVARSENIRKVEAYDAARAVVKREGLSRAEYVLRAEAAEARVAELTRDCDRYAANLRVLRDDMLDARDELGLPTDDYPAPVAVCHNKLTKGIARADAALRLRGDSA